MPGDVWEFVSAGREGVLQWVDQDPHGKEHNEGRDERLGRYGNVMTRASILVVRGGGPDADGLEQHLRGLGYDVCAVAASVDEAVERAAETAPDAALMDLGPAVALGSGAEVNGAAAGMNGVDAGANGPSPDMNGLASARRIGAALHIPVVCLTETADGSGGISSPPPSTGYPLTFVLKPFDARQLRLSLDTALSLREWEGRHRETRTRLEHRVEEMREHIHMMDVIFNSMEEGVLATDQDGERLAFNVGAVRIGGMREPNNNIDEWAAMHGVYLLDKKTLLPVEENPLVLAMLGRETDDQELFVRNEVQPQGVYISVTGRPLKDISNRQRGGVIVFRDITAQKTADVAMRGAFAEGRVEGVDTILHNIGNAISSVTTGVETIHSDTRGRPVGAPAPRSVRRHRGTWRRLDRLSPEPPARPEGEAVHLKPRRRHLPAKPKVGADGRAGARQGRAHRRHRAYTTMAQRSGRRREERQPSEDSLGCRQGGAGVARR